MWPFRGAKHPSFKYINNLIESQCNDYIEGKFRGGYIDKESKTVCYCYIGDWATTWSIFVDKFEVYKYVSGLSDRIEVCNWNAVLLIIEKINKKRDDALAKLMRAKPSEALPDVGR